jgi:hypothetical protein
MSLAAVDARHAGETKRAVGRLAWNDASGGTQVLDIAVPFSSPIEDRAAERERFAAVRRETEALAANLTPEDQAIQSMPDVSPTKWHLAHTSWFFETFLLGPLDPAYRVFDPAFAYLFNSYYEAAGPRHPRPERGLLSRPTVDAVGAYRDHVSAAMLRLIDEAGAAVWHQAAPLVELGLQHEQQHQELVLMDIKHVFSVNPLLPAYQAPRPYAVPPAPSVPGWVAAHPVCCGDWLDFIAEGGYRRVEFWLSEGWAAVQQQGWQAPLYWRHTDGAWRIFTLSGERPVDPAEPVCHVSFYEADAFARWVGKRLPTEAEWEIAARELPLAGNLGDSGHFHPSPDAASPNDQPALRQMIGDVWEWTASPYVAYPRFRAAAGAIGEYNGKFMSNQMVLRGGAAVTPAGHIRATYRNFFPPAARWAFSGLRLAEDL